MRIDRAIFILCLIATYGCKKDFREAAEKEFAKNPISIAAWKAKPPSATIEMRFWASLTDNYLGHSKSEWYSIWLFDANTSFHGFIERNTPEGERLFNLLKDGNEHAVILRVKRGRDTDECQITAVVKDGFTDDLKLYR